ncbi:MAG: vgr related protein [Sphingomicrobium sp.]
MTIKTSRALTPGEIALARSVFGDAIDYPKARLVKGKWWLFHPRRAAMAPMGNIYFHPVDGGWSDDFSKEPLGRQGFFIHEMTHVWQAQAKGRFYLPLMRHPFCRYDYELKPGKPFEHYGLEQQAEIVSHRFLADRGAPLRGPPPRALLPFICDDRAAD